MATHSSTFAWKLPWTEEPDRLQSMGLLKVALSCIGEGNGNPLQCSCLENPRVGGDWWVAAYGVAQTEATQQQQQQQQQQSLLHMMNIFFNGVQLIHSVVLVSGVQQSDLVMHVYVFFSVSFSIMVYYRILQIYFSLLSRRTLLFIYTVSFQSTKYCNF